MADPKPQPKNADPSFQEEFLECWQQLPDKMLFFGLLMVWCALFQWRGNAVFGWVDTSSLFQWMYWAYTTWPDDGHGVLIPFVVLVLFWWKRSELLALPKSVWWPAMALVVAGLFFHVAGYMVQQTHLSIVGFFTGLYGIMGLVWGRRWLRASFFPMILFVFCVPLGSLSDALTFPLRMFVSKISVGFANHVLGIPVLRDGANIFDAQGFFRYEVAAACSGLRSLISLVAMTTIYGFVTFKPMWKKILMVFVAIPLAVVGNIARITGVIVAGDAFGQNAGAFVETKLGFVTFAVAMVCVLLLGRLIQDKEDSPQAAT